MQSIRIRLMVAFLSIALVMAGLSALALRNSWRVQNRVHDLTGSAIARFEREKTLGRALEIEGVWRIDGVFAATEIEVLARPRRPKLRGALAAAPSGRSGLVLYGIPIRLDADTEYLDAGAPGLRAGTRVEVSCSIDSDGTWRARKVRTEGIKDSDKIKGVVTSVAMDGVSPDTLEISGIPVLVDVVDRLPDPEVELRNIAGAVRMQLASQACLTSARRVLGGDAVSARGPDGEFVDARDMLLDSAEDLGEAVAQARSASEDDARAQLASGLWLDPLLTHVETLDDLVDGFLRAAARDPGAAAVILAADLEPHLFDVIDPMIHGYLLDSQEGLALEVEQISAQAAATARALLVASAVALVFAMGLGWLVWRSIANPIAALREAAVSIGRGRLDARVPVTSRDELGVLGETINRMADELAATTVSIANLDAVFESMAGGLFVLDASGRVRSVNRAGADLLDRESREIVGTDFGALCRIDTGAPLDLEALSAPAAAECVLMQPDGSELPVSWSGARLEEADDEGGSELGFVCVVQDVRDRKAMEERLRRSLAEKELLLREVHHRVKNNLQVISSLLDLQSADIGDPSLREMYADSQARIRSMAFIHQQLYASEGLDRIDVGAYVDQLSGSLFQFHGGDGDVTVSSEVVPVRLGLDRALSCGLIINELVTNALKHAFEPGAGGRVVVRLTTDGDRCRLSVADDGKGIPGDRLAGRSGSLGMKLVEALTEQLDGGLTFENGSGTVVTVDFPLDVDAVDREVPL